MSEQCKLPITFEGEPSHTAYCIKDKNHEGPHKLGRIPLSLKISCKIKECLWYRWIK